MHSRGSALLLSMAILSLPLALSSQAQNPGGGVGGTERISQEQGAQEKGNAYGRAPRDQSGLGGLTSAAPLPPILAILLLGCGVGLKVVRDKRKHAGPDTDPTA